MSLLFAADADTGRIQPVSVQAQHLAAIPTQPFRFGGITRLPQPPAALAEALQVAATALAQALQLRGLNGLDGLWDGGRLWVLEINPRPPLSLALQPAALAGQLLRQHMTGMAPPAPDRSSAGLSPGVALVYASRTLSIPADFRFPPGCHDVPVLPHQCASGAPLCSLHVSSGGVEELRVRVRNLRECLLPVAGVESVSSL